MKKADYNVLNQNSGGVVGPRLRHHLDKQELSASCQKAIKQKKNSYHLACYVVRCSCDCHKEKERTQ